LDALSLMAVGYPRVTAIFGASVSHWAWLQPASHIVLAFDNDSRGRQATADERAIGVRYGKRITTLEPEDFGGAKDLNEALVTRTLNITGL
ncbi:MAG: toprim domain-containing protein, partial [Bacteroidota bacterium]